jgi:hypothetical protein
MISCLLVVKLSKLGDAGSLWTGAATPAGLRVGWGVSLKRCRRGVSPSNLVNCEGSLMGSSDDLLSRVF